MKKIFPLLTIMIILSCDNPFIKKKRKQRAYVPESSAIQMCINEGRKTHLDKLDVVSYCRCLPKQIKKEFGHFDFIILNEAFIEKDYKTIRFVENVVDTCADEFIY